MKSWLLILLSTLWHPAPLAIVEKWTIEKESNLYFEGRSNVSNFCCGIAEYLRPDTIFFYREALHQPVLSIKGGLTINVNRFNCRQAYMNKDLLKTLKANECPVMKITLQTIGDFSGGAKQVKGVVLISLAGVTRTMGINYSIEYLDQWRLRLLGSRKVLFSDFKLTPPRKMAGMVKVEEEIIVRFELMLRALDNKM